MATYTAADLICISDACVQAWREKKGSLDIDLFLKEQANKLSKRIGSPNTQKLIEEAKALVETELAMIKFAEDTRKRMSEKGLAELKRMIETNSSPLPAQMPDYSHYLTTQVSGRAAAFERIKPGSTSRRNRKTKFKRR